MTWTYTPGMPSARETVRLLIGDTDSADQQLQDEEITLLLANEGGSTIRAAVTAADTIAAKYARRVSGGQRQASDLVAHYLDLATRLRRKMARTGLQPYAGGLSLSDKTTAAQDTDRVQPFFHRGMESEPGTEPPQDTLAPVAQTPYPW